MRFSCIYRTLYVTRELKLVVVVVVVIKIRNRFRENKDVAFHVIIRTVHLHRVMMCGEVCACVIQNDHFISDQNTRWMFSTMTQFFPCTTVPLNPVLNVYWI